MTDRPDLTRDDYLDAVALCRATLRNDDAGLQALARTMDVAMTFQALVRLHLVMLANLADGDAEVVDQHLADSLAVLGEVEPPC